MKASSLERIGDLLSPSLRGQGGGFFYKLIYFLITKTAPLYPPPAGDIKSININRLKISIIHSL